MSRSSREQIYAALFGLLSNLGPLTATNEQQTIALETYVLWSNRFVSNVSVFNVNTQAFMTLVGSSPAAGHYTESGGVYGFNASDVGSTVLITYTFTGIVSAARSLKDLSTINPESTPALFQLQTGEVNQQRRSLPPHWTYNADVYIYVNTSGNPNLIPSQLLNPIVDQVESFIPPPNDADYTNTLGGLVNRCWMSSPIRIFEGELGTEAAVIIPISILVP